MAALGYAGFVLFLPLAVVFPLSAALLWSAYIAPRASRRLEDPGKLGLEVVYFAVGVIALAATGVIVTAVVLAFADLLHIALMLALKQR